MQEIWKNIEGTDGKYRISNTGKVFGVKRNKCLKPKIDRYGYKAVLLWIDYNKKIYITVHRLVATAFCENPNEYNIVNHKDMNKLNNNADNLEWCTNQYNVQHWFKNDKKASKKLKEYQEHSVEANSHILKVWKNGEYIGEYKSKKECAEALNISQKTIYNSLRSLYSNRNGYSFKLMENPKYKNNIYKQRIIERG